jgi:leucyl aminopeptidase
MFTFARFRAPKVRKTMHPELVKTGTLPKRTSVIFLAKDAGKIPAGQLSKEEIRYAAGQAKEKKERIDFSRAGFWVVIVFIPEEKEDYKRWEKCRKAGDAVASFLNEQKQTEAAVYDVHGLSAETLSFAEGMALGSYQFLKYKKDKEKANTLKKISVISKKIKEEDFTFLQVMTDAVTRCRTLINEPYSYLTATVFAKEVQKMGKEAGARVEVLNKQKIEALKMGGILAVNQASNEPPTFSVMEWKPVKPVNKKPLVFVGKGIVFDTGGSNLKPGDSMLTMKCDMSGAAAVATAVFAIAKLKLPVHVIGLMPATDNKIGPKAVLPGDIITMYSGTTVEVLNTDAEGRIILGDALHYAKKFDPQLVIDLATLTGSAARAIGAFGIAGMQYGGAEKPMRDLQQAGNNAYERVVEFPNWDEYGELIKSDLADLKNLGPAEGGSITAGKFLETFTDYPYIHLDIAGPAFREKRDSYRGKGGTGIGVRLLLNFIQNMIV